MNGFFGVLPGSHRHELRALGEEVSFPVGARIFEEGERADRFWVLRTGTVALDLRVPGRRPVPIETVGPGELLGWSWLFPPYEWHLGAGTASPVRADEYDAEAVRRLCEENPEIGSALARGVAEVVADRLRRARTRLTDLYGPYAPGRGRP
ncbi:cyclic nucleotide-binding domain-containing protein [Streptomyces boncukensis]|uniref:Cyclic nucleotide-binding domain-containing protein n=1 Tax=Streptomyces boncukensis TaxID=2711219 RepID=A0A6G4WWF9_9ACTN|nr:cyclic nucleotide-binding domain-containing protein [Streptomyces boncukensis]NGO69192.1 cyclic nucleotide-binding domain-containing protein [Streptomyces boncukensis]